MINENARFRKIKHSPKDGLTEVHFETPVMGGYDDTVHTVHQAPHPDFLKALQALAPIVIEIAELKGVAKPADVEVRGVSLSYSKNDSVGCIFTAMRQLKRSGPMLINTPTKILHEGDEAAGPDQLVPENAVGIIDALFRETRLFLTGKRSQLEMFDGQGQASTPAAGTGPVSELESEALKAALILSGLVGNPGEKAFDKLDKDFPDAQKIVYLGRAPIALLNEISSARRAELFAVAVEVCIGGNLVEGDGEILDQLATEIASHGATLAPFFEPFPMQEGAFDGDAVVAGFRRGEKEEEWAALTDGQLTYIVKVAESQVAFDAIGSVISDRLLQYVEPADFLELDLEALVEINGFLSQSHEPGWQYPPALTDLLAKWESRANPEEPKAETEETEDIKKPEEDAPDSDIVESLAACGNWLDFKAHCLRFGIKPARAAWKAIEAERAQIDNRPGYRDANLRDEIAERRRNAQAQTAAAKSKLPALENDDLLGQ